LHLQIDWSLAKTAMSSTLLDTQEGYQVFADRIGLDVRLAKAVAKIGFVYPTLVQAQCLPLAMQGKDLLVHAKTGSGKTAAYSLPTIQKILESKERKQTTKSSSAAEQEGVRAIILVPTRELCAQVYEQIVSFLYFCQNKLSVVSLSDESTEVQQVWLRDHPDILIATPARLAVHLKNGALVLNEALDTLVIDEADLVLSFGGEDDIREIVDYIPKTVQTMLMSATLSDDLESLKKLVLHNPVRLKLELGQTDGKLRQFYLPVVSNDKDLFLYSLIQLGLIQGKTIFFVNSTESCYHLKLFLEQFGVRAAVLNGELPMDSRRHILKQFNKGIFDFIIATDESAGIDANESSDEDSEESEGSDVEEEEEEEEVEEVEEEEEGEDAEKDEDNDDTKASTKADAKSVPKKKTPPARGESSKRGGASKVARDREYGVARGVDFHDVTTVVNVDFPSTSKSYIHRIGRTARGGASGCAISLVESDNAAEIKTLARVQAAQPRGSNGGSDGGDNNSNDEDNDALQPVMLPMNRSLVEGLRYRVDDVKRLITRKSIRDARVSELQRELVNSERLQGHFEENPNDLQLLQHAGNLGTKIWNPHLKVIPDYLVPRDQRKAKDRKAKKRNKKRGRPTKSMDPLETFKAEDREEYKSLNYSTSGRTAWQRRHKKGKFSTKKHFKKTDSGGKY
jgi:ATP-dependent RNA helicase DDX56/DBP9